MNIIAILQMTPKALKRSQGLAQAITVGNFLFQPLDSRFLFSSEQYQRPP